MTDNLINLHQDVVKCVSVSVSREVSGRICEYKMLPEIFYGTLLPFAFHAEPVLAKSTISYSFDCYAC